MKMIRALALAVAMVGASRASADDSPRWKFQRGDALEYAIERSFLGKIDLDGPKMQFAFRLFLDTTSTVDAVDEVGGAQLTLTIDRLQVKGESPIGGNFLYDSKSNEEPKNRTARDMVALMKPIVGAKIAMKVSPTGKVSDITLPDDVMTALGSREGQQRRDPVSGMLFGPEGVKEMFARMFLSLPEPPAAADATWRATLDRRFGPFGVQSFGYEFSRQGAEERAGKKLEKIGVRCEVTFEPAATNDFDAEIMDQKNEGIAYFDAATGRAVEISTTQWMFFEVGVRDREIKQDVTESMVVRQGKCSELGAMTKKAPEKPVEPKNAGS